MLAAVGRAVLQRCEVAGRAMLLFLRTLIKLRLVHRSLPQLVRQLDQAGFGSILVLALVSGLTGAILAVQTGATLAEYGINDRLGAIIGASFCREMGPLWAAIIILARVGAAMAAELGTMTVNEEVDALRMMCIDPVRYLVVPRILALVIVLPLLTGIADAVGMAGGAFVCNKLFAQPYEVFLESARNTITSTDFYGGLAKSAIFGAIIGAIACDQGLSTTDGAEGVGRSTTRTVMLSVIFVLVASFIMSTIIELVIKPVIEG